MRTLSPKLIWGLGSNKVLKIRAFDLLGNAIALSSVDFWLYRRETWTLELNGVGTINNSDTDPNGETIQTFTLIVDLKGTDLDVGDHWLLWKAVFTSTEEEYGRTPIQIIDPHTASD